MTNQEKYQKYSIRYLIKDSGYNSYKQANSAATYSSNIGDAIHFEIPKWMKEDGDFETKVIKSTDPEFKKIIINEYSRLEDEINNLMFKLKTAERNFQLLNDELYYGK